ncbi:MAG: transglutaminase domain-containing protein, partial [Halobacteriovoraceae bacterium]|nr:transglutaminase domain-containing protein [Halobacteriovoraceae bacterium]
MKQDRVYFLKHSTQVGDIRLERFPHDQFQHPKMKLLRSKYKLNSLIKGKETDFEQVLALADWVSTRWDHKGIPAKTKKWDSLSILTAVKSGKSFSCAEYASVLTQVCHAVGIPARKLGASTKRPDLGDSGHGHVTVEYWDNQLQKWVWIDPQIHAYGMVNKKPASYFEMHTSKNAVIKFSERTKDYIKNKSSLKNLRSFVKRYNGSISYSAGRERDFLFSKQKLQAYNLLIKGQAFATFLGFPIYGGTYLNHDEFYMPLNQLQVEISTEPLGQDIQFNDLKDYKQRRHEYFATNKICLK